MIEIKEKQQCYGCGACSIICPHSCITMQSDEEGFLYPYVQKDRCIECGLCDNVCPYKNEYEKKANLKTPIVFAVRHKDINKLKYSRSGAMFVALSDYVLRQGGVVYGAGYKDHFKVVHKRANTRLECDEFRGSKYVQSDLNNVYYLVKQDLKQGLKVLFSGTPCQTAGLLRYLNDKRDNLLICDIVCHGTPSPYIWSDYLTFIEKKYHSKIIAVDFRDKAFGWKAHVESFWLQNGKKISKQIYTNLFYQHIMFRPSCSTCKFTNIIRPSDITLADYWGWEKISKSFNSDDLGCSLVFINTEQGKNVWNKIKTDVNYIQTSIDQCMQPNLKTPSVESPIRSLFWSDYIRCGFKYVIRKYGIYNLRWGLSKIKRNILSFIKTIIK